MRDKFGRTMRNFLSPGGVTRASWHIEFHTHDEQAPLCLILVFYALT